MQPYQEASEESTRQSYRPFQAAATLAVPAVKTAIGGKIMSLLNKYVPTDLAFKGLSKLDPRLGKFATLAQEAGHSPDDVKSFIAEKVSDNELQTETNKPTKQDKNIIEQYSPELYQLILKHIKSGKSPIEAGALAMLGEKGTKSFQSIVKKIESDHKTNWSSILQNVFGSGDMALPQQSGNSGQVQQSQPQNNQAKQQLLQAMQGLSQQLRS